MSKEDLDRVIKECKVMKNTLHSALVILANFGKTQDIMNIMRSWAMFYDFEWRIDDVILLLERNEDEFT